jgi:hypothetical protein
MRVWSGYSDRCWLITAIYMMLGVSAECDYH